VTEAQVPAHTHTSPARNQPTGNTNNPTDAIFNQWGVTAPPAGPLSTATDNVVGMKNPSGFGGSGSHTNM
jgi:microcystin-dependent protein